MYNGKAIIFERKSEIDLPIDQEHNKKDAHINPIID